MVTVSILAIGNELLDGRVLNTNQHYLSSCLSERRFFVSESSVVNDTKIDIVSALNRLTASSHVVIVTGGLGPTTDDITSECIGLSIGEPCVEFEAASRHVNQWYKARSRAMPQSNLKQTLFPKTATLIPNEWGTAMGFYVWHNETLIVSLPGVPSEMKPMFVATVAPLLHASFDQSESLFSKEYRCFGLGESEIQDRITNLELPSEVLVSYRVPFPEVIVKLTSSHSLEESHEAVVAALSGHIFSQEGESFVEWCTTLIKQRRATISVAESCTGGGLSALLTSIAGASSYFLEGRVTYSNDAKYRLGVLSSTLALYGAVSEPVVNEMSQCIRTITGSTIGVGISGIAGPHGAVEGKPVGTVCFGVSGTNGMQMTETKVFSGNRERVQLMAAYYALWLLSKWV